MHRVQQLGLVLAGLALPACGEHVATSDVAAVPPAAHHTLEVDTAAAHFGRVVSRLVAPGSIVARRSSEIGTEVTGRIERVYVDVGDRVQAGDLLFEIDRSTYAAAVREAEAALALARAQRRQVESDLKRAQGLRSKEVLSQQQLEQVETQLAVARAREHQAEAALAIARENLAKTRVFAPYAGTVARRLADEGTTARTMPQTIVLELQETAELEGRAHLAESFHARVRVGNRARLVVDGLPEPIETPVEAIADSIDPATRTFLVRMRIPNPDHRIKAGSFARVEVFPDPQEQALVVPRDALRSAEGKSSVLAVRQGETVELAVRLGVVSEDVVEIVSGLEAGEEVVVGDAARELVPGTPVRPRRRSGGPST